MTNSPQDPDQTAPMESVSWPEPDTQHGFEPTRGHANAKEAKKAKKPFTSRKLTLILGAIVFFLAGTFSGIGLNIAFGNAGGDSSQMSRSGGPGGSGQMPGGGSTAQATAGSGSGNSGGSGNSSGSNK